MGWKKRVEGHLEGLLNDKVLDYRHDIDRYTSEQHRACMVRFFFDMWLHATNPVRIDGKVLITIGEWILTQRVGTSFMPAGGKGFSWYDPRGKDLVNIINGDVYVVGKKICKTEVKPEPKPIYDDDYKKVEHSVVVTLSWTERHYEIWSPASYNSIGVRIPWICFQLFQKAFSAFMEKGAPPNMLYRWYNGETLSNDEIRDYMHEHIFPCLDNVKIKVDEKRTWEWAAANITAEMCVYFYGKKRDPGIIDAKKLFRYLVARDKIYDAADFFQRCPSVGWGDTADKVYKELRRMGTIKP